MILDTPAVLAILRAESDARVYARAIAEAGTRRISAANYGEAAAVIDGRRDRIASRRLEGFFRQAQVHDQFC
jgi:ribonuclease VapC